MLFTQVPNQHAPVGGVLRYAVQVGAEKKTVTVSIVQTAQDAQGVQSMQEVQGVALGRKRFVEITQAQFDIAPYVRRAVKFEPQVVPTGVYAPDGRVVEVVVEAGAKGAAEGAAEGAEQAGNSEKIVAPTRRFLPGLFPVAAPAILTEMPRCRGAG